MSKSHLNAFSSTGSAKEEDLKYILDFYPEDNNCLQISFHMVQYFSSAPSIFTSTYKCI